MIWGRRAKEILERLKLLEDAVALHDEQLEAMGKEMVRMIAASKEEVKTPSAISTEDEEGEPWVIVKTPLPR
jgi:hypothetical protein